VGEGERLRPPSPKCPRACRPTWVTTPVPADSTTTRRVLSAFTLEVSFCLGMLVSREQQFPLLREQQFPLLGGLFRGRALIRSNGGVRRRDLLSGSVTAKTELAPLRGRPAQVARKDQAILAAAREVFLADPTAPISAVVERVDVRAPYHRYESKEDLLRTL
jgi:hypothetical protein